MIAVPAIDLRDGACVQLVGGDYRAERVRWPDPVAVAEGWRAAGFTRLHLVDLDRATDRGDHRELIARIARIEGLAVQVGGGLRTDDAVAEVLQWGATSAVVGTRAIEDPAWLDRVARRWAGQVVLAADVRGRRLATRGWAESAATDLDDLWPRLEDLPLAGVLVTAIHLEGRLNGPDLPLIAAAVAATRHPIQASGGIARLEDLDQLRRAGAAKAIIGMALYTGHLASQRVAREFGAAA
jgi:phosphoribosylformimino-5-aminoimidazole carboxamide ribotide isomerase